MATATLIPLGVFRDKDAPFDPSQSKCLYSPTKGRGFYGPGIRNICNVSEGGTTYAKFEYYENEGAIPEDVLVIQASGAVMTLVNA